MNHFEKQVKQILMKPEGRAALKKFGIEVELVKDKKELEERPTVVVLCPTYRAPEPQMQDALAAMVHYTRDHGAIVYGGPPMQASVVHWSRNGLITEHLKSGKPWSHVLFIDDDIVVEPDALTRLLGHKKDIVAGLCTRRIDPPVPNIRHLEEGTGDFRQIWEWPANQLIEVGGVGTGLMLISQNALEQVAQAYFDCLWEQEFYGFSGEKLDKLKVARLKHFDDTKQCYWFRFLPALNSPIEYGEDISFCFMAKRYCDIPIFVDTAVQPGHIGSYPFSVRDFLPHQREMISRAKAEGRMKVPGEEVLPISILCPTRKRPDGVRRLLKSIQDTAMYRPEVVLYVDEDDSESLKLQEEFPIVKFVIGSRITLSNCWNRCAEAATGQILMNCGDDIVFKTKGWDRQVMDAFLAYPDRMVFVHGNDGAWGDKFGTHGFVHRKWLETVGYFIPPYFSSDYGDTWLNEVANKLGRRVYLPFITEHLHPIWNKAEWDETHKERLVRHKQDNVEELYKKLAPEREQNVEALRAMIAPEMAVVG